MKVFQQLLGLAGAVLALTSSVLPIRADNPPWPPTVMVVALDPCGAEEGSDTATFAVIRTGPADAPLAVQYQLGGSAVNGADYEPLSGLVTIPAGQYWSPVTVTPVDDYLVEGTESVVIALTQPAIWPPPYIVTWPAVAVAHIADNDSQPPNRPPQVSLVRPPEGAVFEAQEDILLVARASDPDGRVVTVEFFADGVSLGVVTNRPVAVPLSAVAEDPAFELDADAFPDLDSAPLAASLPIHPFRLWWSNAPLGEHVLAAVATDNDGATSRSAPVHIKVLECPPQPVVTIRAVDPVATEPNPDGALLDTALFRVHRTGPTNFPLQVWYRIGGTALNGVDYKPLPRSLLIPAGARSLDVMIEPLDDLLVEGLETVVLTIEPPICIAVYPPPPDCYRVGWPDTARAVIRDNDLPPNRPPVVRLVKPEDGDVFLAPANIRLVALARDFDGYVTTVEFFEGTNSLGIVTNNPTTADAALPAFSLVWSNVPPGRYVLSAVATDNGGASTPSRPVEIRVVPQVVPPVVNLLTLDPEAAETLPTGIPNPAVFAVTRTGGTQFPLVVFYSVGGSASNGLDYRPLTGRVLIPAGAVSNHIVVEPIDDLLVEGLETVLLKLEPAPILSAANTAPYDYYRIGSNYFGRAVIRDNDLAPTNLPPKVALVEPEEGEVFIAPVDIRLAAAAHDPDGWVRTVEFFSDGTSLGIVTNSLSPGGGVDPTTVTPEQLFWLLWKDAPPGTHHLTAKATDNRGAASVSDPVRIRILPPPIPVVTIEATDPYASEGGEITPWAVRDSGPVLTNADPRTAVFTVFRRGPTNLPLTVYYRLSGTALNGTDYRFLSGEITIPAGARAARILVVPIDDPLPEPTETVVATLVPVACPAVYPPPPACYIVGDPNEARAFIFDNDFNQAPRLAILHPQDGMVFRAGSDIEIDVVARDADGWVTKVQFFANGVLIGEQGMHFIIPPPPGQPQKFFMIWSNVPPALYSLTAKATDNQGGMALSDAVQIKVAPLPPLPVVTLLAVDPVATEPNPLLPVEPDTAMFKVVRTGDLTLPLTVWYRVAGTASNGLDYVELAGWVTLAANSSSAPIEIRPLDDNVAEGTESIILSLVQPPCVASDPVTPGCYIVGRPGRAIAYLRDNDSPPNQPPTVAIVSPPNGAVFTAPVTVRLVAAAADPDGWVTTVEFFDGSTSLGIVSNRAWVLDTELARLPELGLAILPDQDLTHPFSLLWSNVPPGRHELTAEATDNTGNRARSRPIVITVLEPVSPPVVSIMAVDPIAREGTTNTAAFRVRRTGATNDSLTVSYTIRGTALNGVDYAALPGRITIPAGRRSARILIEPLDDNLVERCETVVLRLLESSVDPLRYLIGRPAAAMAVILDNDYHLPPSCWLPDGNLHFRWAVPPGMPYRVEASTNLLDWEAVVCDVAAESAASFLENREDASPCRFFRIVPEFGDLEED
ncbi:MAG TPA: Calx-beta domain-containing protein [Verrucomicrobiota bacterium]|nr:Calx-beta domain-containing protein [Verrucomicrobiota bacterium]